MRISRRRISRRTPGRPGRCRGSSTCGRPTLGAIGESCRALRAWRGSLREGRRSHRAAHDRASQAAPPVTSAAVSRVNSNACSSPPQFSDSTPSSTADHVTTLDSPRGSVSRASGTGGAHRGVRAFQERRRVGEEPHGDHAVEDHAAERGSRHERPNGIAPHVMHDVPAGMNQPADGDPSVTVAHETRSPCR